MEIVNPFKYRMHQFFHGDDRGRDTSFNYVEDTFLGPVEDFLDLRAFLVGLGHDLRRSRQQFPEPRFLKHDSGIVVNMCDCGDHVKELCKIRSASDRFEFAVFAQSVGNADEVDG